MEYQFYDQTMEREKLNEREAKLYDALKEQLIRMVPEFSVDTGSDAEVKKVLAAILLDCPSIFWFTGEVQVTYGQGKSHLFPRYSMDWDERIELQHIITSEVEKIGLSPMQPPEQAMEEIRMWFSENIQYGGEEQKGQTIDAVFVRRKSVCGGIARAVQYLLQSIGISSSLMYESLDGKTQHIWNLVQIDGKKREVDITMSEFMRPWYHTEMDKDTISAEMDGYQIAREIGRGSMSKVYQVHRGTKAAMKVMHCGEDLSKWKRALRECSFLRKLKDCPNIITYVDSYTEIKNDQLTVYLVEEFATPLNRYCRTHTLDEEEIGYMLLDVCDGMIQCHRHGIAHLDIRPENLFVASDGRVKVGDFSHAVPWEELPGFKKLHGTRYYMAPEIVRERQYYPTADVYAFGVVMYHWLAGDYHLMDKEKISTEARGQNKYFYQAIEDLEFGISRVDPEWMEIIRRATAYDPDDRFQTFKELKAALQACIERKFGTNLADKTREGVSATKTSDSTFTMWSIDTEDTDATETVPVPVPAPVSEPWPDDSLIRDDECWDVWNPGLSVAIEEKEELLQEEGDPIVVDDVVFSALSPKTLAPGSYGIIEILMYEDECRYVVDKHIEDAGGSVNERSKGIFKAKRGMNVRVCLTSPDIPIEDETEECYWNGKYSSFSFYVNVPEDYKRKQILFIASVYFESVPAVKLKFLVDMEAGRAEVSELIRQDIRSAFMSYAREDMNEIYTIVQGMRKVRPDLSIFVDVDGLRSGQNWKDALYQEILKRDILYLCWSRHAKASEWVEREWRYALEQKGIDAIEPLPLEPPEVCEPPEELKEKHFHDRELAFRYHDW